VMTQCPLVSSVDATVGVRVERMQQLPKSASSSSLSSLQKRRDRRASNPAAAGEWYRRGPSSSAGSDSAGSNRRPSVPSRSLTASEGTPGQRPPKPHRGW